jgi:hypothetical protein
MWLFTRYGFYSAACASKPSGTADPAKMMVRSRLRSHLENLRNRFPGLAQTEIVHLAGRDYRWRMFVDKQQWAAIVAELVEEQGWSNFKNEAQRHLGKTGSAYIHALHDVWQIMSELQGTETTP